VLIQPLVQFLQLLIVQLLQQFKQLLVLLVQLLKQ